MAVILKGIYCRNYQCHAFSNPILVRMRMTLRRSCDACAKSKLSCDLRTPQCSRCAKKHTTCVYANQPLTSSRPSNVALFQETFHEVSGASETSTQSSLLLLRSLDSSLDPFDSYPRTKLARTHEQRLIQHCRSPYSSNIVTGALSSANSNI